ncbi:hypothetical protein [Dyadobacter sp. LHD-138]|uniref:hypothetical protein n=1 Tax=Dyadobacter sp. LHD-138 TaxID=3071413 RepID=UPI0027E05B65|nr:hypothetical protein [Dyadobacter sp. LHD-138]MDQ6479831.1 hypothetical protein [Dyadobacter sp. LHD-138]
MQKPTKTKVRREEFTPLGHIYYKQAKPWQRTKIEAEVFNELGLKRSSVRAYMVSTPGYRMRADMKEIILRTLPEAKDCFIDPRIKNQKTQPV